MSISATLIPLAISLIALSVKPSQARKSPASKVQQDDTVILETKFCDAGLLMKTLQEHGIRVAQPDADHIVTEFDEAVITYSRASEGAPFMMEVRAIGDTECLLSELDAIENEYEGNVQSYVYDRVINNLPKNMSIESEEVMDDDSIVITVNVG